MPPAQIRLGVDIGGTFTDVVLETATGLTSTKVLTTHNAPEQAILKGMSIVCAQAGCTPGDIDQIIHGTTLATNALIERRGARTALITTEGFRDVIEMRTESRFEQYDLNLVMPEPLLPRQARFTVPERLDAKGNVLVPIALDAVDKVIDEVCKRGFESVAIGLLHAYANPAHERAIRDRLSQRAPSIMVSLSSDVSPQMREYERFNTTVANAYIKPLMKSYLDRLSVCLAREGARCPVFMMHSGGGIISLETAAEVPVRLVESGPAGGAVFAADLASRHGLGKVLSFDMGGTTAKICLVKDQTPKTARVFEVARSYRFKKGSGMPISIPVIDMVEIGAGGGSLASVDGMGQIRVGPRSAGSQPGPVCYGRGGTEPSVTDADLLLGKLDPARFAGGTMPLDTKAAAAALGAHVAGPLGLEVAEAAHGVVEVVDETMANAARMHAVETGEDLAGYTMIAFGGAAPLHAARLAQKLGISRVLVPPGAGVGSAIGFLRAPFSFEATRTEVLRLSDFDPARAADIVAGLRSEAEGFVAQCGTKAPISVKLRLYMRYVGQGWEIPVDTETALDGETVRDRFDAAYRTLFGRSVDGMDVEITQWAVTAMAEGVAAEPLGSAGASSPPPVNETRSLYDFATGAMVPAKLISRDEMQPGSQTDGPAVIVEQETSVIVPSNSKISVARDGTLDLRFSKGGQQ